MFGAQHYGHLARRGFVAIRDQQFDDLPPPVQKLHEMQMEMPSWGIVLLIVTLISGVALISSMRYTLYRVVATLAMVESPQTTIIVRQEKEKLNPDALAEDTVDAEVLVCKTKPITASIKGTIQHLQSRGGFRARWRGLSAMLAWGVGYACLKGVLTDLMAPLDTFHEYQFIMIAPAFASILSRVILSRFGLTWTHIVISEPSTKPWYKRVPGRHAWKQIALPTLFTAVTWQFNFLLPAMVATALNLENDLQTLNEENFHCWAIKVIAVVAIAFVWFLGICIPAEVALTRVQASMLPEGDESIVPFDRTFGGAVEPKIVGGSGKLGYFEAWQTFDRPARLRLLKLFVKIAMVDIALHALVALTLITQLMIIVGPQLETVFATRPADKYQDQWEAVALGS